MVQRVGHSGLQKTEIGTAETKVKTQAGKIRNHFLFLINNAKHPKDPLEFSAILLITFSKMAFEADLCYHTHGCRRKTF